LENRKIFFDISTSYYWKGEDVGIVRTEKAIAKTLLNNMPERIVFCLFSKERNNFTALSRNEVSQILTNKVVCIDETITKYTPLPLKASLLNIISHPILKNIFKKIIPSSYHSTCVMFYNSFLNFIYAIKCIRSQNRTNKQVRKNIKLAREMFSPNDVYISLGLDWDKGNLTEVYNLVKDVGIKTVLFCYDLIPYKFPQFTPPNYSFKMARYFTDMLWCSNYIICISESSKNDLLEYAKTVSAPLPSLKIINIGCDLLTKNIKKVGFTGRSLIKNKDFILTVSTIEPRKNHATLYNVWQKLYKYDSKNCPILVITGRNGWLCNELQHMIREDTKLNKHIIIVNDANDSDLEWLYKNCLFTVFPSFYEGWGIPVAESLYYGKYCITSNTSSLPEVSQNLTKMLDPLDIYSWYESIKDLLENRSKLKSLEDNIKKNYKPITLNIMALNFLDFIKTEFNIRKN
jgi:glycosyltransferase involved in cell wall biosynthesis